jgi:hypothetical protein
MDVDRTIAMRVIGGVAATALITSVVVAVFAPDFFERYVGMIMFALPALISFFTLLSSTRNSEKLNVIDDKTNVIDEKATAAKIKAAEATVKIDATRADVQTMRHDVASTASIVEEHVPAIAQKVEEIKQEGGHSGHTPPHGIKRP